MQQSERAKIFASISKARKHHAVFARRVREVGIDLFASDENVERSRHDENEVRRSIERDADVALNELVQELRVEKDERPSASANER